MRFCARARLFKGLSVFFWTCGRADVRNSKSRASWHNNNLNMLISYGNRNQTHVSNGSENGGPPREARLARVKDHAGYGGRDASDGRPRSSPAKAWVNLVGFTKGGCLLRLGFPPHSNQAKGWRRLSRWTRRFARPFQPTSFGRGLRNGRTRRSVIPSPLMMAHEPRVGARHKARRLQENNVRSLGRTRFEPISSRTGASPSFLRRLQRQPVSSYPFGSPFFEAERPFVGAHRRAAIQRRGEHNTNIGACQDNSYATSRLGVRRRAFATKSALLRLDLAIGPSTQIFF